MNGEARFPWEEVRRQIETASVEQVDAELRRLFLPRRPWRHPFHWVRQRLRLAELMRVIERGPT